MVKGLIFNVSSTELKTHLTNRRIYHEDRAKTYLQQATNFQEADIEGMKYTGGDPIKALRDKESEHRAAASMFEFMAAHVIVGEEYQLDESELRKIEMVSGRVYY